MRNNDLTGKKFGRLTVIKRDEDRIQPIGQHKARWLCKCDCGDTTLGYFSNFEEAVRARKEAEEVYFGEYSYDNSMKTAKEYD